ncbi:MAG: endonuclease MutS2 [Deltaproteobacteria bacterium]|nr:endonuclease MutS2 [Deltaproteobacteria bacterium]
MEERTLTHLDFHKVLGIFEEFAKTPGGKEAFRRLRPDLSRGEIEETYRDCQLLKEIVERVGPCPLDGVPEIWEVLKRLQVPGVVLDSMELLNIALFVGKLGEIGRYFKSAEEKSHVTYTPVSDEWENIPTLYPLKAEIEKSIDPTGYIKDRASPRLRDLRRKAERQKGEIQKILDRLIHSKRVEAQLTDQYYTVRNGRYVLPIKAGAKHTLQGIIHDQSQSRLTFFIEPIECVELNNSLSMTYQEIEREEEAVRRHLTGHVAESLPLLWRGWEIVTRLDEIHARVLFMTAYEASPIRLLNTPGFSLSRVRHPLLMVKRPTEVVPIDLKLPEGKQILILSGVNAGGKTVALKTLGLSILMMRAGLPVTATSGSEAYPFAEVFTEIGDEQSIADELSTFTAHVQHLKEIIEKSEKESLVLIDEIGAGTGMSEGAALALGILDVLEKRGATVMATTHFEHLKGYGARNPRALNVSVAFDTETQKPLFTLRYGIPGNSNAFEMARRQGLNREVLEAAKKYRTQQDRLLTELMGELEALKHETDLEREMISDARREIQRLRDQFYRVTEEISGKKAEILKSWQMKWDRQIKKQRETFHQLLEKAKVISKKEEGAFHATYSTLMGEFNRMSKVPEEPAVEMSIPDEETSHYQAAVGDEVFVATIGKHGRVAAINPRQNTADVVVKGLRLQVPVKKLRRGKTSQGKKPAPSSAFVGVEVSTQAKTELNVVGYRVEEALPEVDKFIDTALVHNLEEVTIIHGVGSGRLKKAIREFLSTHEGIKGFSDGDLRRGGHGITVVQLRA